MRWTLEDPNSGSLGCPKTLNLWNGLAVGAARLSGIFLAVSRSLSWTSLQSVQFRSWKRLTTHHA
jgi:hypothetical protein